MYLVGNFWEFPPGVGIDVNPTWEGSLRNGSCFRWVEKVSVPILTTDFTNTPCRTSARESFSFLPASATTQMERGMSQKRAAKRGCPFLLALRVGAATDFSGKREQNRRRLRYSWLGRGNGVGGFSGCPGLNVGRRIGWVLRFLGANGRKKAALTVLFTARAVNFRGVRVRGMPFGGNR